MANFGVKEVGSVSYINTQRGFGFLRLPSARDDKEETFFHSNQIKNVKDIRFLRIGDAVECFVAESSRTPGKREAQEVHVLTDVSNRTMEVTTSKRSRSRSPQGRRQVDHRPPPRRYDSAPVRSHPTHDFREPPPHDDRYDSRPNYHQEPPQRSVRSREYGSPPRYGARNYDPHAPLPQSRSTQRGTGYSRDFRDLYASEDRPPARPRRHSPPPPEPRYERPRDPYPRRRSPPPHRRGDRDPYGDRFRGRSPPPLRRDRGHDRRSPPRRTPPREYHGRGGRSPPPHRRRSPPRRRSRSPRKDEVHEGKIVRIHDRGYGFIKDDKHPDKDWFFPAKEVRGKEITDLEAGDKVLFKLGRDHRSGKWEAQEVILQKEEWMEGKLVRLKDNFGFIETKKEPTIYFHGRHIQNGDFKDLKLGDRVSFLSVPSRSRPGTKEGQQISLVEDGGDEDENEHPAKFSEAGILG